MYLVAATCIVRDWRHEDAPSLARHADNPRVWANLRDRFPSPYSLEDAEHWVRHAGRALPATDFAIQVEGEAAGGIGVVLRDDVDRVSAELGFWLGEPFWGRGVMTGAVTSFVPWAFERFDLSRIFAQVFAFNAASARVLEKAGFVLEATLRRSAIKGGAITDQWQFAKVRER